MPTELPTPALIVSAMILGGLGVLVLIAALVALVRVRPISFAFRALVGLLLLSLGSIAGMIGLGIQGYRALTREDVVARLSVRPAAPQKTSPTTVRTPDIPLEVENQIQTSGNPTVARIR